MKTCLIQFSDVPGRVAKALVELNEKFGEKRSEGFYVEHDLTQEELAQLVGASRETVNKALADFVQREWIKLEPRAVLLLDVDRLNKRARQLVSYPFIYRLNAKLNKSF